MDHPESNAAAPANASALHDAAGPAGASGSATATGDGSTGETGSSRSGANVPKNERILTGAAGAVLTAWGIRRGGIGGLLGATAGAALLARSVSGHCPMYAHLGTSDDERELAARFGWRTAASVQESVLVNRPRDVLYRYWRDLSNFGSLMSHVERVEVIDERRSHWVVKAPMGQSIEFESTLTEDIEGRRLAWLADEQVTVRNAGWVEFRDAGQDEGQDEGQGECTEVRLFIAYEPPGGELGRMAARFLPEAPGHQARDDLQRFKQLMESGTSD